MDDILIASETIDEHNKILEQVVNRARKYNIKFNKEKVQWCSEEVKFLGHIISKDGVSCDEERMGAINDICEPKDKNGLQKLLGMINYARNFVPNLAEMSSPLRELLKKNVVFKWLPAHTSCLNNIKSLICNAPKLKIFDPDAELKIQTDASKAGLGCCLMQGDRPISFASRSLTDAETRYSQIEKEFLAVVFACQKFHFFIYGRRITVITDHKPLLGIIKKKINKIISARLQRMKIRLLKYNIDYRVTIFTR